METTEGEEVDLRATLSGLKGWEVQNKEKKKQIIALLYFDKLC